MMECVNEALPNAAKAERSESKASSQSPESSCDVAQEGDVPYQETEAFCTWRKHVRDLYQHLVHIDIVWESPSACLMPYMTTKGDLATQTVLCGTRTGGQEQSYLQMLSVTTPLSPASLGRTYDTYCEATGEVGGYGMAPHPCGLRIERRMLHDGDPLAVRYMPANPLIIGSGSSDGNVYVFDWSRVSLNKFPNDPPRPRAPLPPNELSANATDEERLAHQKRMRALRVAAAEQNRWDQRRGEGQQLLTLRSSSSSSSGAGAQCGTQCHALDWSVSPDGVVAGGSRDCVRHWQIAAAAKDEPRTVRPVREEPLPGGAAGVSGVAFSWAQPHSFAASCLSGELLAGDVRAPGLTRLCDVRGGAAAVVASPRDGTALLVGAESGEVHHYDVRHTAAPVAAYKLHARAAAAVQWCPHSRHLFASGGEDATCCVVNATTGQTLFKHAGHTDSVTDIAWNWQEGCEGQILSVDTNALMLWRPRDCFFTS